MRRVRVGRTRVALDGARENVEAPRAKTRSSTAPAPLAVLAAPLAQDKRPRESPSASPSRSYAPVSEGAPARAGMDRGSDSHRSSDDATASDVDRNGGRDADRDRRGMGRGPGTWPTRNDVAELRAEIQANRASTEVRRQAASFPSASPTPCRTGSPKRKPASTRPSTDYVREEFNRAEALANAKRAGTVGFALTLLQRRLASSPEAIYQSLRRRRERLEGRLRELEVLQRGGQPRRRHCVHGSGARCGRHRGSRRRAGTGGRRRRGAHPRPGDRGPLHRGAEGGD